MGTTRPGCQQSPLCCFRGCSPVLCRMLAKVRQLAGSRQASRGEHMSESSRSRISFWKGRRNSLSLKEELWRLDFLSIYFESGLFFGKKGKTFLEHRNTDIILVVGESFFSRESHMYLINQLTLLHNFLFCWLTDSWGDLLGRNKGNRQSEGI